ncbi:MFS transporter [Amycolatopsis sp. cmx-4-83]|uniref:MFS transporter n=1 Tax=Amycolatopsis sp. cmx-4-83 TaxID=2790940 RepID=UPI00397D7907
MWALVIAGFTVSIGYGFVAPAIPLFAREFGVSLFAASAVVSVFALCRLLAGPLAGRVTARLGERNAYVTGLLIVAVTTGACAAANQYWQLLALRAVAGAGAALFAVAGGTLLARSSPTHLRGRVSGLYSTFFVVGGIAGPALGALLVVIDLRTPFLVYAAALLLAVLVMLVLVRGRAAAAPAPKRDETAARFTDAVRRPAYRAALASNFANGWASLGVRVSLVPLFVAKGLSVGESWAAAALTASAVGTAGVLLIAGAWADRAGRKPPLIAGLALVGGSSLAMGLTEHVAPFLVLAVLGGAGSGLLTPPLNASVADVLGEHRGGGSTVMAGFQMAADAGMIVGPLVAGALAGGVSFTAAFASSAVCALLGVLLWWRAPETKPAPEGARVPG